MLSVVMMLYVPMHMICNVHVGAAMLHYYAAVAAGKLC